MATCKTTRFRKLTPGLTGESRTFLIVFEIGVNFICAQTEINSQNDVFTNQLIMTKSTIKNQLSNTSNNQNNMTQKADLPQNQLQKTNIL
jgi:sensor c-di-GMP phosphodiesterase-like protein